MSMFATPGSFQQPLPPPDPMMDSPFAIPSDFVQEDEHCTPLHHYPLPPEGRLFKPTYEFGKYALPDPETGTQGKRFTRVTSKAHVLEDTYGLEIWKQKNVVMGLKIKPELLDDIDLFDHDTLHSQLKTIANKAQDAAGANDASEMGTAIHAWTEAVERDGLPVDEVPQEFRAHVQAYLNALSNAGITTVPGMVERIVWHKDTGMVGTLDRIYELADGTRVIGDVKTSKSLDRALLGFAVQLAVYADADRMLSLDGSTWEPMAPVGNIFGVIAHIPSNQPGVCNLVTIDLQAGRDALELAQAVEWARTTAGTRIPNIWPLPQPSLETRISNAQSVDEISQLWANNQAVWTQALTDLGMARIQALTSNNAQ